MGVAESKKGIELWVNDQPYLSAPSALIILQRAMLKKALKEQVTVEAATDPRDSTNVHTATLLKLIWGKLFICATHEAMRSELFVLYKLCLLFVCILR